MIKNLLSYKKTISWTLISMTITFLVILAFTGSWKIGATISITERIIKLFPYYGHERWWESKE